MNTDFIEWLLEEMNNRGWGSNELARRANITSAQMSRVLNQLRNPGIEFCHGIANAFGISQEEVLCRAKLIHDCNEGFTYKELWRILGRLSVSEREDVLHYALGKRKRDNETDERTTARTRPANAGD